MRVVQKGARGLVGQALVLSFIAVLAACSDSDSGAGLEPAVSAPQPELSRAPFQELLDQGVNRYLGEYTPMLSSETDGVVTHQFGAGDGPLCLHGSEYKMLTRDAGSEDLVIFMDGGGACWPVVCVAEDEADSTIGQVGVLDPNSAINPVADWNVAFLPYCDGSIHGGDIDHDTDGDGVDDQFHRGLHNVSAGLDVTVQTFPQPRRILLAGVSGGGYGTLLTLPLVRTLYPDVPIEVLNDSGLGVTPAGDPMGAGVFEYWNMQSFVPASCPDCISDGVSTVLYDWMLSEDDNFRLAATSYKQDSTIGTLYTGLGDPAFEEALVGSLQEVESLYPERVHSFFKNGTDHTLLGDLTLSIGDLPLYEWLDNFLFGTEEWVTVIEE